MIYELCSMFYVLYFAIFNIRSAICHLPSAICHLPFAICINTRHPKAKALQCLGFSRPWPRSPTSDNKGPITCFWEVRFKAPWRGFASRKLRG